MTDGTQGVHEVGLLVAAYTDEHRADKALEAMQDAKARNQFYFDDAAVVRRDAGGTVYMKETGDMTSGRAAGVGALVGGVIGVLGGPAGIVVGAGAGAAIGALAAATDGGFDEDSLKEVGAALPPGTSALVATTSQEFVERIRAQTPKTETMRRAREIAAVVNTHLRNREDALFAMVLNEEGTTATRVIFTPQELTVLGIAGGTGEVAADAGVATPEEATAEPSLESSEEAAPAADVPTQDDGGPAPADEGSAPPEEEPKPSE